MSGRIDEVCQYHNQDHAVITDLKDAIKAVVEGQQDMRSSIVQLTEAFKNMDRIEARLEKMQEHRARMDEKRDDEIQKLKTFMNRAVGWGSAGILILSILLKFIGV